MRMLKCLFLWLAATMSAQASIVNVLSPSVGAPEDGWDSNAKASLQHLSGNESKLSFSLLAGTRWVRGPHQLLIKGSADWGEASDEVYSRKAFAHVRWKQELSGPWSSFVFGQIDHNEFRSLLMRDLLGAGLEFRLWRNKTSEAAIATSAMAELEWVLEEDTPDALAWRSSTYIVLAWLPSESVSLGSTTFLQPLFSDFSDIRGLQQLDLKLKLTEHLSWSSTLKIEVDTEPAEDGVETLDSSIKSGLVLSW